MNAIEEAADLTGDGPPAPVVPGEPLDFGPFRYAVKVDDLYAAHEKLKAAAERLELMGMFAKPEIKARLQEVSDLIGEGRELIEYPPF